MHQRKTGDQIVNRAPKIYQKYKFSVCFIWRYFILTATVLVKPLNSRGFYKLVFADSAVKESTKFNKRVLIPWLDGSYSFI